MKDAPKDQPRALVLGGYGLIGAACVRALQTAGYLVTGVGRDADIAARIAPDIPWIIRDIGTASADDWAPDLQNVDVIVNASGALQDGARDNLKRIHEDAIEALITAAADRPIRFVQISAAGVDSDASTSFFRTKARGDQQLMHSELDWVILRPTLVLGRAAYGGTALLRAAAAMPLVGFRAFPDTQVQTVALEDLCSAVVHAARGGVPGQTLADVTASDVHSFDDLTKATRRWLGLPDWRVTLPCPASLLSIAAKGADLLGKLGWRSPMRSTALAVLQDGIKGDPTRWQEVGGTPCRSLEDTLRAMPATVQDRWFARLFLGLPLAIGTLSLFWLLSGLIGLFQAEAAMDVLRERGVPIGLIHVSVYLGAALDIALGLAILFRRYARRACLGMIALSAAYLVGGTMLTTDIWMDPLGPFVKVLPAMTLAALTAALLDDR